MNTKPQKKLTGRVVSPLRVGERAHIISGDEVTCTSLVAALHETSKNKVVIETMNTIYIVESESPDSNVCLFPVKKKWSFNIFAKLRNHKNSQKGR